MAADAGSGVDGGFEKHCFIEAVQAVEGAEGVEAGEDVRKLIPHFGRLRLVEIAFPRFRDGRGYSAARVLRENGYAGELRAEGDVLVDQLLFMRRCGFDSFASDVPLDRDEVEGALGRYPYVYQEAADGLVPIWKLRHG